MKVLAISEESRHLDEIRGACEGSPLVNELAMHLGSLAGVTSLPVKGDVDILVIDCRHGGAAALADLERLQDFYPSLNAVLVIEHESPELLLRALRLGVREVLKAPLVAEEMQAAFQRILSKSVSGQRGEGKILAFMSCKGGSGASFLATNLGYVLAEQTGKRVLLIDLNLQFGDSVLYVSDRRPSITLVDIVQDIQRIDMSLLRSAMIDLLPNYAIISGPEDPTLGMDIRPSHIESLLRFARSNFDFILLDVGRSLDTCTIQALDMADHVYPVLQLTLPFLRDAKRLFDVYRSLDYTADKVRPILNRVERSAGDLTEGDANRLLAYKIYATVPNHYKSVTASVNQGVPILKLDQASPVVRSLELLSHQIAGTTQAHNPAKGIFGRLFARD